MSTEKTFEISCSDLNATLSFGEQFGKKLRGGEVFELVGDLGSGKTALVRGFARALGVEDEVTSPSFTINNVYKSKKLTISHYDFYRLGEAGILSNELEESLGDPLTVTFIEWGTPVKDILPMLRVVVRCLTLDENTRRFSCTYPSSIAYLFEGLKL